ncbi:hypothetical protein BDW66DRAFT_123916 [Aspergillus desertorum]
MISGCETYRHRVPDPGRFESRPARPISPRQHRRGWSIFGINESAATRFGQIENVYSKLRQWHIVGPYGHRPRIPGMTT